MVDHHFPYKSGLFGHPSFVPAQALGQAPENLRLGISQGSFAFGSAAPGGPGGPEQVGFQMTVKYSEYRFKLMYPLVN